MPTRNNTMRRGSSFSRRQAVLFILGFGVIGGFFVIKSFASPLNRPVLTIEAESMELSNAKLINDPSLTPGANNNGVRFGRDGTASAKFTLKSSAKIINFVARTGCKAKPTYIVADVDGQTVANSGTINSLTWGTYASSKYPVSSGTHILKLTQHFVDPRPDNINNYDCATDLDKVILANPTL